MKPLIHFLACLCLLLSAHVIGRAQKPELVVQTGHTFAVTSVAFSPDGKLLVSGSSDNTLQLSDVATGTELRTFIGHTYIVSSVAFSSDGRTLASGGVDKTVKLWDVVTGAELHTLKGHSSWVNSVVFSPDGRSLASSCEDGLIKLWDVATGVELRGFTGHEGAVTSVAFSRDGQTLASSGHDKTIKLWNVATGVVLRTLAVQHDRVKSVAFSPDGKTLASGGWLDRVKLWEVATGAMLRTFKGDYDYVESVAFSPDGQTLAGVSSNTVKLWDVPTGAESRTLEGHAEGVRSVAFSPLGRTLAAGSGKDVKLWDAATGAEVRTLNGHSSLVTAIVFSPDGKTLARSSGENVRLWDVVAGAELRTLRGHFDYVTSVAFSPDGKMIASGSHDRTVRLWDVATGTELSKLQGHTGKASPAGIVSPVADALAAGVTAVAFSPDGQTLASGSERFVIKLWKVATGAELRSFRSTMISSLAFSPDGKTLASGGKEVLANVQLRDVATGTELHTLKGQSDYVAFSPDGTLASGSQNKTVKLWDVVSGREIRAFPAHAVTTAAFSSNGKTLATGSKDNTIRLWDVASSRELRALKGHSNSVTSVRFSPNNKYLVSGSYDGSIKVWEVSSGQELASLMALDDDDWIVVTPDGLFDGSPAAWNKILWRFNNNTFDYAPVEAFFSDFYYPGLLTDIFAGMRPKAPSDITKKDRRQPQLSLSLADAKPPSAVTARSVAVKIDVSQAPAGAQDVRLFRNGSLVKAWRGDVLNGQNRIKIEATIPIVAGENRLAAYGFNHDNIKSSDATLVINGADNLKRASTLYVLAVGVGQYANSHYNLNYAAKDAKAFAAEVSSQQKKLARFERVEVIELLDQAGKKANVLAELKKLAGKVQPEDVVIVYFSGHGAAEKDRFYLIPHDIGYTGSRKDLGPRGLQTILIHSISDLELEEAFRYIDAAQLLLVIDACNSGQALESEEKRRGPMNSKGLAQLAYEKGMYILTASQSYEVAFESEALKHSYLTYALIEGGLKTAAADSEPTNGEVTLREWLGFATREVPRLRRERVERTANKELVEEGPGERQRVQQPRLFYRREPDVKPLVVAKPGSN